MRGKTQVISSHGSHLMSLYVLEAGDLEMLRRRWEPFEVQDIEEMPVHKYDGMVMEGMRAIKHAKCMFWRLGVGGERSLRGGSQDAVVAVRSPH